MKKLTVLIASTFFALFIALVQQALAAQTTKQISPYPLGERSLHSDRAIAERIAPSAQVCVQGEECKQATVVAQAAAAGPRAGSDIYNSFCMGCHMPGNAMNAPAKGDAAAWNGRASAKGGVSGLVKSAVAGIPPMMPPKGNCGDCSDAELKASIEFMMK